MTNNIPPTTNNLALHKHGKWAKWVTYVPNIPIRTSLESLDLCRPSPRPIRTPSPTHFDEYSIIMTGREDNAPAKLETNHKENYQGRDNALRSQEIKQHKRSNGVPNKPLRPNMEIYRPRNNLTKNSVKHGVELTNSGETVVSPKTTSKELLSSKNGVPKEVHFVDSPLPKKPPSPPMGDLKSALKRSKSFTADEGMGVLAGFDREAFPKEDQGLIRRAVLDPNSLSCQKLMELVRLICKKAIESAQFALPAAQLCFSIIEKEHDHTFLESLQNCCREWYNERDRLLRAPVFSSQSGSSMRRWTAYVSFLTELYLQLKGQQHHQPTGPYPNSPMAHMALTLQTLLFECANIILRPPSINSEEEVGTLRRMLFSVGTHLQSDTSQRMDNLVNGLRDAFLQPSIPAQIRKILLELVELQASGWNMNPSQAVYYFDYTRM